MCAGLPFDLHSAFFTTRRRMRDYLTVGLSVDMYRACWVGSATVVLVILISECLAQSNSRKIKVPECHDERETTYLRGGLRLHRFTCRLHLLAWKLHLLCLVSSHEFSSPEGEVLWAPQPAGPSLFSSRRECCPTRVEVYPRNTPGTRQNSMPSAQYP